MCKPPHRHKATVNPARGDWAGNGRPRSTENFIESLSRQRTVAGPCPCGTTY
uniref:Uncharacterized protein n=1 Tax=Corynebacterium phage HS01 TaxID=3056389 RepID=A0AA50AC76_9VIRU|nr:MAG: hypothetical protein [Corynebacterium phage HS01]